MTTKTTPIIWFKDRESTRQLPPECIADCSGSGDRYDNVKRWVERLNFDGPVDQFKEYLDGFGCWDDEELKDHYENRCRVLWLWAGYCLDYPDKYDYLYLD
mgnify:FL=1